MSLTSATAQGHDRPGAFAHQTRSEVIARHGIVATSQPLAAQAGLRVLQEGGNAADAAIAANAVIAVTEPMSCGLGGDLFVIYWDAKSKKLHGLNACGRSPYNINREVFRKLGLTKIPTYGPLSWSVPGCVDGWSELQKKFGTKPFSELLAPAIEEAEDGFPVSEIIAGSWKSGESSFRDWPDSARTFLIEGKAPAIGQIFRNPNLARSLKAIATGGRDAFYTGDIAREIVRYSEQHGGYFSLKDFQDHASDWIDPVSTNYRGYDVWELPPNGQGIAALQMLNILEGYDFKSLGPMSPEYLHLFIEAKKLAYADRAKFYADPAFNKLPVAELISKPYAAQHRKRIHLNHAATEVPAGDPGYGRADTIYLTVVDKDRNCCSLIQSIYSGFGSQVVPGNVGFPLQNRGNLFALDDTHLNGLEPHKRPFHTIIPGFVTKDGQPWLSFGVMGGDMQPQGHVQVLVNMIDFGMNVQAAGDAARLQHFGSATPTGDPMAPGGGTVGLESGFPAAVRAELERKGHTLVRAPGSFGGYQGILIDQRYNVLRGGTDVRKDGCATGY